MLQPLKKQEQAAGGPGFPQPTPPGLWTQGRAAAAGGRAGEWLGLLEVSTCGGFHLSPAATTAAAAAAAAAGSDPPPCWPLTCCGRKEIL